MNDVIERCELRYFGNRYKTQSDEIQNIDIKKYKGRKNIPSSQGFFETTPYVKSIVDKSNLSGLDEYINHGHSQNLNIISRKRYKTHPYERILKSYGIKVDNKYDHRMYHVLSYAIESMNMKVLNHMKDRIVSGKFEFNPSYRPDEELFNLLDLAIENWLINSLWDYLHVTSNPDIDLNKDIKIISLLMDIGCRNEYAMRHIIHYCYININDYKLADILINKYNCSVKPLYYYAIIFAYKGVFDKILENYINKIDFNWTLEALDDTIAYGNKDMKEYVINKIKNTYPDKWDKLVEEHPSLEFYYIRENDTSRYEKDDLEHIKTLKGLNEAIRGMVMEMSQYVKMTDLDAKHLSSIKSGDFSIFTPYN